MIPAMWTPLHYPFIGGAPRLQNELEGSHSILNLQVYFNFDGGAKINEGGSPEPQLQVPVALCACSSNLKLIEVLRMLPLMTGGWCVFWLVPHAKGQSGCNIR